MVRLLSIFLLLSWLPVQAQTYFNERYPHNGEPSFVCSVVPTDSGYLTMGQSYNPMMRTYGVLIRWLDPQGNLLRTRSHTRLGYSIGAPAGDNLMMLPDGGFVVSTGCHPPSGDSFTMLWRFNAQGDTLWTRSYPLGVPSYSLGNCRTADGGFAITGDILSATGHKDLLLLRTDSAGNMLWYRQYRVRVGNIGYCVVATADQGFILGGYTFDAGFFNADTYVIKTDSVGGLQWQRTLGARTLNDLIGFVRPLADGNYAVLAAISKRIIGGFDQRRFIIYKLNGQGQTMWQREIGPARSSTDAYALLELPDGSLVGAGQDGDPTGASPRGNSFPQGAMFKLCPNGDSLWYRNYKLLLGGNSHHYPRCLQPTADSGFVVGGFLFANFPDVGTNDGWVFKTNQYGQVNPGTLPPMISCQPTGLSPEPAAAAELVSVYPNPSATGRFTVALMSGMATLTVTDALGRQLLHVSTSEPETMLDLSHQPAGMYVLRLQWPDGRSLTRKLLR